MNLSIARVQQLNKGVTFFTKVVSITLLFLINLSNPMFAQCLVGNCEDGYGEMRYESGGKYEGEFRDGMRDGHGKYTWKSGAKYMGNYSKGEKHGHGIYYKPDGSCYVGGYKYGVKQGSGTEYDKNGYVLFAGDYNDDKRINVSSALSNDILRDKYLLEAKKFAAEKNYSQAIISYNKLLYLNAPLSKDFYYQLGKCHYQFKDYERSVSCLNKYVINSGKQGEFYINALEMLSSAESKANLKGIEATEKKQDIKNCSTCSGTGYYTEYVKCSSCKGIGKESAYCSWCGGNGQSKSTCTQCGGTGFRGYKEKDGTYTTYDCMYCINGWANCKGCNGMRNVMDVCSDCKGTKKLKKTKTCYH